MKKSAYRVCPTCGSLTMTTGNPSVTCCGRLLAPLTPQKADGEHALTLEPVEDEWFVTCGHPMEKEHYISFLALATGDSVQIIKFYPQWDLQARIPRRKHGVLLHYCTQHGLFQQYI